MSNAVTDKEPQTVIVGLTTEAGFYGLLRWSGGIR